MVARRRWEKVWVRREYVRSEKMWGMRRGCEDGGGGRCGIAVSHVLTNGSIFKFGPTFFTLSIGSP